MLTVRVSEDVARRALVSSIHHKASWHRATDLPAIIADSADLIAHFVLLGQFRAVQSACKKAARYLRRVEAKFFASEILPHQAAELHLESNQHLLQSSTPSIASSLSLRFLHMNFQVYAGTEVPSWIYSQPRSHNMRCGG